MLLIASVVFKIAGGIHGSFRGRKWNDADHNNEIHTQKCDGYMK